MHDTKPREIVRAKSFVRGPGAWIIASLSSILSLVAFDVQGQALSTDAGPKRTLEIVPRISISETWTDNVRAGNDDKQADQITEISPGILVKVEGSRLKGNLDYSSTKINYSKNSSSNQLQNALNAFGTLEAVDNFFFIDASGQISQQLISAFGTQTSVNTSINSNQTEVSNYRLSPSFRGRITDSANYEARWTRSILGSKSDLRSGVGQTDLQLNLNGATAVKGLAWSVGTSRQTVGFSEGRPTEADRTIFGIVYALTPQVNINASTGLDSNNYSSLEKESQTSSGIGFNWIQSERTTVSGSMDQRSFGRLHSLNFDHRTGRTAWRITDSKSVTTSPNQIAVGSIGSIYDILYSQFSTIEPNPGARAQLVNSYLQTNNINPNSQVLTPFLIAGQTITRRQDVTFALLGSRSTVSFIASQTSSQRLDSLSNAIDDYSSESSIEQRGLSINYSHRLTPEMTLSALATYQKVIGVSTSAGESTSLVSFNLTKILANRSSVSAGFRRVNFSGISAFGHESAVSINLNLLF
jgi:uncharacterized protein (PEP-CTERM system associated)